MQRLSKLIIFLFLSVIYFSLNFNFVHAQAPIPELLLSCSQTRPNEFHSLRPYQASPCGDAPKAKFCSNKLVIFETFDLSKEKACLDQRKKVTGSFDCDVNFHVDAHDLNITLDQSEFPIMGNTEDDFDDAQKVNEYASWYLNGVIDKRENEDATDEQIVNFSGPVKKLIPSMIQDVQRISIIESAEKIVEPSPNSSAPLEVDDVPVNEPGNHNQLVVDDLRLSDWSDGNLSITNTFLNWVGTDIWNKKYPPLPWQFSSEIFYRKAYNEWQGKNCAILPVVGLQCLDTWVSNKWSQLWHFVPLSNNSDQKGKNYLLTADGPSYVASQGTEVENAQHKSYRNAPLYFPHTQEVYDLTQLLKKTYQPTGYESEKLPKTTEQIKKGTSLSTPTALPTTLSPDKQYAVNTDPYANLDCSAVNVRTNAGDNLFPGDRKDEKELYVQEAEYDITQVKCDETYEPPKPTGCGYQDLFPCREVWKITCIAQVGIEFKLGTQTPYANEIYSDTVADSGSTFRKIFPKVGEDAPVECIADIPTTTNVTYDINNDINEKPAGGDQELKQTVYPADGANDGTQLTFPHVGSVYEYFLKGIQTALRPKGYGEPLVNGNCKPTNTIACGELPEGLPKATGLCNLGDTSSRVGELPDNLKEIISAAAETYKVQPNVIVGVLFGEGVFNQPPYQKFDWTEENVNNWATCEPIPNCSGPTSSLVSFVSDGNWQKIAEKIARDLRELDPNKTQPDPCNLLDVIYGIAWNLHDSADGGMDFQCFGVDLSAPVPTSCDWSDNQIVSAIKVFENGYERRCFTKLNSCATGGGNSAGCIGAAIDSCETIDNRYSSQPSHMGCVYDVSNGN